MSKTLPKELTEKLPAEARETLRRLAYEAEEVRSAGLACGDQLKNIIFDIQRLERRRQSFDLAPPPTIVDHSFSRQAAAQAQSPLGLRVHGSITREVVPGEKEKQLAAIDAEIAAARNEEVVLKERRANYSARMQGILGLIDRIQKYLETLPEDAEIIAQQLPPAANKSSVTPDLLENKRREVCGLLADLKQIDDAPLPIVEAKKRARDAFEVLAERGRPAIHQLIERGEDIDWPTIDTGSLSSFSRVPDAFSIMAWVHRKDMIAALEREIDDTADDAKALTDVQRTERFRICLEALLQAEREEEAMVRLASFDVIRRTDADPRAVLGLSSSALPGPRRELFHRRLIESKVAIRKRVREALSAASAPLAASATTAPPTITSLAAAPSTPPPAGSPERGATPGSGA
jgi:hypothetical protein